MPTEPLFRRLAGTDAPPSVRIHYEGRALDVPAGATVAAALLLAGVRETRRSPVGGGARAPYCMMGVCFECLVEIDGEPSRQACLVTVREGMQVRPQLGLRRFDAPAADAAARAPTEAAHDA